MTTLVGIAGKDFVVMAADSAIVDNNRREISVQTPKIYEVNDYLIGFAGDVRAGQILHYQWKPPRYKTNIHPIEFMGNKIVPSIRSVLKENGFDLDADRQTSGEDKLSMSIFISFNAYMFAIDQSFTFNMSERGLFATGSGGDYALGYLYSLRQKNYRTSLLSKVAAERAVEIGCLLDINSSPPIKSEVQYRKVK